MSKECLTLVRRICRYAVHLHVMRSIEFTLKLPTVNPSRTKVLNDPDQKSVCAYVRSAPTPRRLGMLLMMQMGLRIGEVCGLQWGDFDLQNGVLSVRRTVGQGKMSVKVLKTNDTWYGMTYHEDVAAVRASFKKMLEKGVYKADLFADL